MRWRILSLVISWSKKLVGGLARAGPWYFTSICSHAPYIRAYTPIVKFFLMPHPGTATLRAIKFLRLTVGRAARSRANPVHARRQSLLWMDEEGDASFLYVFGVKA